MVPSAKLLQLKGLSSYPNQAQLSGEPQGPSLSISRVNFIEKNFYRKIFIEKKFLYFFEGGDNTQLFSQSESVSEDRLCGVTTSFGDPN